MDETGPQDRSSATLRLARLEREAGELRERLAHWGLARAASATHVDTVRAAQLLQANEQLVLAALDARTLADAAAGKLDELKQSGQRDPLTGTPNRALMRDRVNSAISLARRHNTHAAVLFIDLDSFKQINDDLGHAAGDEVLKLVARRLEAVVRDSDTVSRHGGDEFLVLLAEVSHAADARLIADTVLSVLAAPCSVGGQELILSASLGIAVYPDDGQDAATLIQHADAAMYRAKPAARQRPAARLASLLGDPPPATAFTPAPATSHLAELHETHEQLALAARTAQRLAARAEGAHSQQIDLLAGLVHEMLSPLSALRSAAALAAEPHAGGPDPALVWRSIDSEVALMTRLVAALQSGLQTKTTP